MLTYINSKIKLYSSLIWWFQPLWKIWVRQIESMVPVTTSPSHPDAMITELRTRWSRNSKSQDSDWAEWRPVCDGMGPEEIHGWMLFATEKQVFLVGKTHTNWLVDWLVGWLVGYCNISKCDGDGENNSSGQKNDRKTCHRCTTSSNFTFTFYDCQQLKVPWIIMNLLFFQSPSIDQICWWLAKCCRVGGQPGV